MIQDKCDAIDLNLGCPQGIARKGFYGSFLQDEWDLIYDMISTLHVNLRIPVCAKIRIFKDRAKDSCVRKTCLFCRREYSLCPWTNERNERTMDRLSRLGYNKRNKGSYSTDVVMFANGNIQFHGDLEKCLAFTGVDGIMSAEGHLYNPAIFMGMDESLEKRILELIGWQGNIWKLYGNWMILYQMLLSKHICSRFSELHLKFIKIYGICWECRMEVEDYEKVVSLMEERIEKEMQENPEVESDVVPWYRCQPYLRPERTAILEKENAKVEALEVNVDKEVSA